MSNLHNRQHGVQLFLDRLNLQFRFLFIIGASVLCFALVIWWVFSQEGERLVERLGARFAEKQVLYDKARTLQPLIREVALARQMADSTIIKQWVKNEQNPQLQQLAMAEIEKFRQHFQEGSYFLALTKSGHYYFNDASRQYANKQLRYTLSPDKPGDAWFYATIKNSNDYQINVDPDIHLGVTKVWINVLLRDGDKVLGVLGTGLDLTDFIRNVADIPQPGVTNLFVDRNAAIQIYRDIGYIDFSSITKSSNQQHSIDLLLEQPDDRAWIRQAISQLAHGGSSVVTKFVQIGGKRYLAGVVALPEVGWYDITLLDLTVLLPQHDFLEMGLAVGGAALGLLLVLAFTLHRLVLRPVAVLTDAAARISRGNFAPALLEKGSGEVGQLTTQFQVMADVVYKTHNWLEEEIEKHTRQLTDAKKMLEILLQQEKDGRETQANLLALMAHEIRSPVAVIGNTAQMLNALAQAEQPDWQPRIEKIMGAVRQLALLMDNFLAENRINMKSSGLELHEGDLNVFCAELVDTLAISHNRAIRYEPYGGDARLSADWQLIGIAIGNFIDNAVKYSSPESEIGLRVLPGKAGTLCVDVTDHGSGIAPELQQHIFGKFIRGQHGTGVQGTGIGLYLVNWIAQFHGGYAEVSSVVGTGSTFRLCLLQREQS
jgi:signal transduction histidine kinase